MAKKDAELVPLMLRLPQRLRRIIEKRADDHRHSLNSEVIHMLEEAIAREDRLQLIQQVATTAATATWERFQAVGLGSAVANEAPAESPKPADSNQKDKAT